MNKQTKFEKFFAKEIGIELKSCLYFYCILFFCSLVLVIQGKYSLSILTMAEVIAANYVICNIQVYVFHNFDEADVLRAPEILGLMVCTGIYTAISYLLSWFDRKLDITIYFAIFIVFSYICVNLIYKIKRNIETKELNNLLSDYKKRNGEENERSYKD